MDLIKSLKDALDPTVGDTPYEQYGPIAALAGVALLGIFGAIVVRNLIPDAAVLLTSIIGLLMSLLTAVLGGVIRGQLRPRTDPKPASPTPPAS